MRKIIAAVSVLIFAVFMAPGCGKLKNYMGAIELAAGGDDCVDNEVTSPYYACYSFENGAIGTLSLDASTDSAFTGHSVTTERANKGTHCLKINCDYKGAYTLSSAGGDVSRDFGSANIDLTGKTITAYVWVPANMFNSSIPYGMFFYLLGHTSTNEWTWFQGPWQNLQMPNPPADGEWNSITAYFSQMTDSSSSPITSATLTAVHRFGIKICKGNSGPTSAADYSGYMYIDSITIQ